MKVLFINTVYGKGSTGRIVKDLGEAIEKTGGEYRVAYGRGKFDDSKRTYFIGSLFDRLLHVGIARVTDRAGFYSSRSTKKLIDYIREYNPDIIHLHNLHGYYLNIHILFTYLKEEYKGKIVWTLHDCWAFTGHCVHFTSAKCDKWLNGCAECPQKKEYPCSCLMDSSNKNYTQKKELYANIKNMTIVTVSKWLEAIAKKSMLNQHNIFTVYNGIDVEKFSETKSEMKNHLGINEKKMILSVSDGWTAGKGYVELLEVASKAPCNWHFVVIGLDKKQIGNLPKNITGLERVWDQGELIKYYSAADVFFNPSMEETFGLVTAEAMACGTPAVVMNSTACPELITDEQAGVVLDLNADVYDMVDGIRQAFGKKGARRAAEKFSGENFIEEYMKIYNE